MKWTAVTGSVLLGVAAASLVGALYNQYKAHANLAGDPEEARRAVLRRGPFAGRRFFTDTGWRYWRTSFLYAGITLVLLLLGGVLMARP